MSTNLNFIKLKTDQLLLFTSIIESKSWKYWSEIEAFLLMEEKKIDKNCLKRREIVESHKNIEIGFQCLD